MGATRRIQGIPTYQSGEIYSVNRTSVSLAPFSSAVGVVVVVVVAYGLRLLELDVYLDCGYFVCYIISFFKTLLD